MDVIALALYEPGELKELTIPIWVKVAAGLAIGASRSSSAGVASGRVPVPVACVHGRSRDDHA